MNTSKPISIQRPPPAFNVSTQSSCKLACMDDVRYCLWEAAKWVARVRDDNTFSDPERPRVRDNTFSDPERPVLLNLTTDIVEENRFLQTKESALEIEMNES
ncbi:hypothetical protein Rs2_50092 [Raphanus sativus]|nr:hypothetical protein Rs2_50092 [Raphanus sativus]